MIGWLKRARQTRTDVDGQASQLANRRLGELAAYRATMCTQIAAQLLLWISLAAYGEVAQTTWQSVCMLAAPLAALFLLWRDAGRGLNFKAARYVLLALIPCLVLDAAVLATALDAMMGELIPSYPPLARVVIICGSILLCVSSARKNGVAYSVGALRRLLVVLFLLATVFVGADISVQRLWPIMGDGLGGTLAAALEGAGCLWGVALLFALPTRDAARPAVLARKRPRTALWAFAPLVFAFVWALWHGMARAWRDIDLMTMGERMMGLARNSRSILLCELAGLLWLTLLPCALAGCAMSGQKLLCEAIPNLPKSVAALALLLPAAVFAFFCGDESLSWLRPLLPYRAVLSAAVGGVIWLMGKRKGASA